MAELRYTEEGTVRVIRGCIVIVEGFKSCINGQVIKFGYGTKGIIIGFSEDEAQVLIIRQQEQLKTGDKATATMEPFDRGRGIPLKLLAFVYDLGLRTATARGLTLPTALTRA